MTLIVILGPDGSGKSTVADMLVESFLERQIVARHYAQRFGFLPKLSSFKSMFSFKNYTKKPKKKHIGSQQIKYDLTSNHPLKSLIYITWYAFDYCLGGIALRVKNRFSNNVQIAIFARYFFDYYYQSNNRRLPNSIKQIIGTIVPEPTFIFFISRDANDIFNGKPELPVHEIKFQQQCIVKRLGSKSNFKIIDGRLGPAKTVSDIMDIILKSKELPDD